MELWQGAVLRLLYLTPLGYILSTLSLLQGKSTKGVRVDLSSYSPVRAHIKQKPTEKERLDWFINGVFLLAQGWIIITKQIAGDIGGAYALVAFIFGLVCIVSAIIPSIPWNKKF